MKSVLLGVEATLFSARKQTKEQLQPKTAPYKGDTVIELWGLLQIIGTLGSGVSSDANWEQTTPPLQYLLEGSATQKAER